MCGRISRGWYALSRSAGVWQNCIGFNFNPPFGVEHLRDDHGGRWADAAEYFSVRTSDFLPVFNLGDEHAGAHHVLEFGARLVKRLSIRART